MKKLAIVLLLLSFAFFMGFILPQRNSHLHYFSAVLSLLFGILSWSLFYLIVPTRYLYHRKWAKLRFICIPLIWVTLVTVFSVCLWRVQLMEEEKMYDLIQPTLL